MADLATVTDTVTVPATPRRSRTQHWETAAAELRADPDGWRAVATGLGKNAAKGIRRRIALGELAAFAPAGAFEARTEVRSDGHAVLARHVGHLTT